jgi:spermidine/putrescine transport system permease protein
MLLTPGLAYLVLFFVAPVGVLLLTSLYEKVPEGPVGATRPALRWENYTEAIATYAPQFGRSFLYALVATRAGPRDRLPAGLRDRGALPAAAAPAGAAAGLVIAPFFTSFVLRTIAWKQILADESVVVQLLRTISLLPDGTRLTATPTAVVAGLTYNFLPFMTLRSTRASQRLDVRLIEAGSDLYATPASTFPPRNAAAVDAGGSSRGSLLTFIPAAGDYVNAALLGTPGTSMVGNVIDSRFFRVVDYPTAAALSVVLMAVILVLVAAYVRRSGTEELL